MFDLTGADFLVLADGTLPTVTFGTFSALADSASGCTPLTGPAGGETCTGLVFTVPTGAEQPGVHDVMVTNPAPADCFSTETVQAELVPRPSLASLSADVECIDQADQLILLTGSDFLVLADGTRPTVTIGSYNAEADSSQNCQSLTGPAGGEVCTELVFTLPTGSVPPGVHDVVVTNPETAECFSTEPIQVEVVPAPTVTVLTPPGACDFTQPVDLLVSGAGFLDSAAPCHRGPRRQRPGAGDPVGLQHPTDPTAPPATPSR